MSDAPTAVSPAPVSAENQAAVNRAAAQAAQRSVDRQTQAAQREVSAWGFVEQVISAKQTALTLAGSSTLPPEVKNALVDVARAMGRLDERTTDHKMRLLADHPEPASGSEAAHPDSSGPVRSGPTTSDLEGRASEGKPVTLERVV